MSWTTILAIWVAASVASAIIWIIIKWLEPRDDDDDDNWWTMT